MMSIILYSTGGNSEIDTFANVPDKYLYAEQGSEDFEVYQYYLKIMESLRKNRDTEFRVFNNFGVEIPRSELEKMGFVFE